MKIGGRCPLKNMDQSFMAKEIEKFYGKPIKQLKIKKRDFQKEFCENICDNIMC